MIQHRQEKQNAARVPLRAFVDREQPQELTEIVQREDRSISSLVRMALAGYLARAHNEENA
jgi:hypothetical protein